MEDLSHSSDVDFEIIPKDQNISSEGSPTTFNCKLCDKRYKRQSTLTRHMTTIHERSKILKLKLENESLELKIKMYSDQIRFLKRLILIQEHTVGYQRSTIFTTPNNLTQLPFSNNK